MTLWYRVAVWVSASDEKKVFIILQTKKGQVMTDAVFQSSLVLYGEDRHGVSL